MRAAAAFLALMACLVGSRPAAAKTEGATYSLGFTRMPGAESCIGAGALARAVEARLGGAGALARAVEARLGHSAWVATSAANVLIEGYVEKRADVPGWHVQLVLTDMNGGALGQRDIVNDDDSCDALGPSLTLMLALIIDPTLLVAPGADAPPPPPVPTPAVVAAPTPAPSPAAPPKEGRGFGRIELGTAWAVGLLPGVASGEVVDFSQILGDWTYQLGGTLWSPQDTSPRGGAHATFSMLELHGRACLPILRRGGLRLLGCAGSSSGVLSAQGVGFGQSESSQRPVALGAVSTQAGVRIWGPVWLALRLSGIFPFVREEFVSLAEDGGTVSLFRMSPVVGAADFSVGVAY